MVKREYYWDNIKFLMILSVVIGHFIDGFSRQGMVFYQGLFLFIYSFHMPAFIFVSGLFSKTENIKNRVLFFVGVGFASKIMIWIAKSAVNGKIAAFKFLSDSQTPWYMFAMAAFTIIAYLLRNVNKWYVLILSVAIACLAGYDTSVGDYLYISRIVVFFPFFWLGNVSDPQKLVEVRNRYRTGLSAAAIAVLCVWIFCCFFKTDVFVILRHLFTGKNSFEESITGYGFLARLFCYLIAVAAGAAIMILVPGIKLPLISKMGTRTIDAYIWHLPVLYVVNFIFNKAGLLSSTGGRIAFLLSALVLTLLLSTGKVFSYPVKWIKKSIYTGL
ncbi:MAG: acyltransferase family protein [Parasporobacterium sp.]|nr:acyltransferase family protein [Parasporobacterium sp.]